MTELEALQMKDQLAQRAVTICKMVMQIQDKAWQYERAKKEEAEAQLNELWGEKQSQLVRLTICPKCGAEHPVCGECRTPFGALSTFRSRA